MCSVNPLVIIFLFLGIIVPAGSHISDHMRDTRGCALRMYRQIHLIRTVVLQNPTFDKAVLSPDLFFQKKITVKITRKSWNKLHNKSLKRFITNVHP